MRFHTTHIRDSSLRRLNRINRWTIAASIALTGLFTEAAAHAFPGKSKPQPARSNSRTSSHHVHRARSPASKSTTAPQALRPPESSPQAGGASTPPAEAEHSQAPTEEPAPAHETAPAEEPVAPEPEIAREGATEPAPQRESAPPVVSGGS
jgi:hypothetical protein